jgi:hypothetical protein
MLALVDGKLSVLDWKSSKGCYPEFHLQTAAYVLAWEEEHGVLANEHARQVKFRYLVRLGKEDGEFEVTKIPRYDYKKWKADKDAFLATLELYRWVNGVARRKSCTRCGKWDAENAFNGSWCLPCKRVHARLMTYNLSDDEYKTLLEKQDGKCAICGLVKPLRVDHCHVAGKVRGLLCHGCNVSLGHFKDSIPILEAAIQYLKKST